MIVTIRTVIGNRKWVKLDFFLEDHTTCMTIRDAICLPESWIWNDDGTTALQFEDFTVHHNALKI